MLSCLNAHEKHVALQRQLTRVQRSPVKYFVLFSMEPCTLLQNIEWNYSEIMQWQSVEVPTAKLQEVFGPILLKNIKISNAHNFGNTGLVIQVIGYTGCFLSLWAAYIQKNMNTYTRSDSRSTASLGLIIRLYWLNATVQGLCHWNFQMLPLWLALGITVWCNNEWEVLMRSRTSRLLRNVHHRAMITLVSPLHTS